MAHGKTRTPFVSCIKIKGIHLLPPLITEKKRIELQHDKQQAIKLEKRLKNCKELKKNLQELLNFQPLADRPESEITFRDDGHVEALGIIEKNRDPTTLSEKKLSRKISLTEDIVDVTEYNNDGIKMIQRSIYKNDNDQNQDKRNKDTKTSFNKPAVNSKPSKPKKIKNNMVKKEDYNLDHDERKDKIAVNDTNNLIINSPDMSPEKFPKPRLIRSNSYTLDSPSPILLAHLEKTTRSIDQKDTISPKQFQQLSQSRNWSSLENNYVPFENSNFSSINTVYNNEDLKTNNIEYKKTVSPMIELIQTDISVQQISVNTNDGVVSDSASKSICDTSDPNSQLMQILQNIPEDYSHQIIELIKNQEFNRIKRASGPRKDLNLEDNNLIKDIQSETKLIKTNLEKELEEPKKDGSNNCECIESENNVYGSLNSYFLKSNVQLQKEQNCEQNSLFDIISFADSISPSQSIQYSIKSSDTLQNLSSPSVKLIDLETDDIICDKNGFEGTERYQDIFDFYVEEQASQNVNIRQELFPKIDTSTTHTVKQEWAASVIGAYVKGYLTRRLLKTERVQTLIDTINDALICALQLHNTENIEESDVELHRRLINQVSAACYAFHDIFFNLSVQEKMSIISTDRQRKLEKAKRPASTPKSQRSTSISSRSSSKQSFHTQSLTKV